jgi:hypothetical protein
MSKAENFPFIVKIYPNEKIMKKQCKMYAIDERMQILAKFDTHVGTWVDLVAVLCL